MRAKAPSERDAIAALLAVAGDGGPEAGLAARRAALLAERHDLNQARAAMALAARLTPLDPTPRLHLARMHAEAGDRAAAAREAQAVLDEAIDQGARARAAFMLGELARIGGDNAQARGHYQATLKIEDVLLTANRSDPAAARWYARARGRIAELDAGEAQFDAARAGAQGALAMLRASAAHIGEPPELAADIADAEMRLAALELDDNNAASARRRLREAIGRYEALVVTEADEPHWRAVLADAWALAAEADYARGAPAEAREAMDKALQARLKLASNFPNEVWALAGTWRLRAALLAALGDAKAAAQSLEQARLLAAQLAIDHADAPVRFLVHTLLDEADHALRTGALAHARDSADAARQRAEHMARQPNAQARWFGETAACWDRLGEVARSADAPDKAQDAFARAVELRRMALSAAPDAQRQRGLAAALLKLGEAALVAHAPASARVALNESVALRVHLSESAPDDPSATRALAVALERLGLIAQAGGERQAARKAWENELALTDRLFTEATLDAARFRAIVHAHLAGLGEADADRHRIAALTLFDSLAQSGAMTTQEAALRRKLSGG